MCKSLQCPCLGWWRSGAALHTARPPAPTCDMPTPVSSTATSTTQPGGSAAAAASAPSGPPAPPGAAIAAECSDDADVRGRRRHSPALPGALLPLLRPPGSGDLATEELLAVKSSLRRPLTAAAAACGESELKPTAPLSPLLLGSRQRQTAPSGPSTRALTRTSPDEVKRSALPTRLYSTCVCAA